MQDRPAPGTPVVRLATGVIVAALGAVLVAAGLTGLLPPAGPGPGSRASAPVTAATAPSVATPTTLAATAAPSSSAGGPGGGAATSSSSASSSASPAASGPPPASAGSSAPGDPVLVGAGDIGRCDSRVDDATAALVQRTPGIVFVLGDNAYDSGTAAEFRDCYGPGWGRFLDRTRFAAAGNHDYMTAGAAPFKAYFGAAAVRNGVTWFSEDVGSWHVIVLDANCGELAGGCRADSPQVRWLRADLAASAARCTLALWHQPRFSSGVHGNDTAVQPFWDALYAAGADLVLNGHDHDYERFAPQDPAGASDPAHGITEIVVGTGGGGLRPLGDARANSVVRSASAYGVIVLTLRPSGWAFRFAPTDGTFTDKGQAACH